MAVADHARDLPGTVRALPEVDELGDATALVVTLLCRDVTETMRADLKRPVAIHGMRFERARDEVPPGLAADVGLDAVDQRLPSACDAPLVVRDVRGMGSLCMFLKST